MRSLPTVILIVIVAMLYYLTIALIFIIPLYIIIVRVKDRLDTKELKELLK